MIDLRHDEETRRAIGALRHDAAAAGDTDQVAICDRALDSDGRDAEALDECLRVIADARAAQGAP